MTGDLQLPAFEVVDLHGRSHQIPADLPASRTAVILAFRQSHQQLVDAWIARLEAGGVVGSPGEFVTGDEPALLEVPVLSRRWRPFRGFIDGGMAAGIKVPRVLARTQTAYMDRTPLFAALQIPDDSTVCVAVVERSGRVLTRVLGEADDDGVAEILRALTDPPGGDAQGRG